MAADGVLTDAWQGRYISRDHVQAARCAGIGKSGRHRGPWRPIAALGIALALAPPLAARAGTSAPVLAAIPAGRFGAYEAPLLAVDAGAGRAYLAVDRAAPLAGCIDVLDSATGRLLRTISGLPAITAVLLAPQARRLFLRTSDLATVRVLDTRTGRPVRALSVRPYTWVPAFAVDAAAGRLYVAAADRCPVPRPGCTFAVLSFDTRTGARQGAVTLPALREAGMSLAVDPAAHRLILVHAALFLPGARIPRPYDATTGIQQVAVIDTARGRLIRQTALPIQDRVDGPPVVDPVSGRTFLVVARPHYYPEEGLIADHAVLVFDTRSGRLVRAVPLGAGAAQLAVDGRTGAVFAASYGPLRTRVVSRSPYLTSIVPASGSGLEQLDPSSGAVVRRIATGTATTALAIDSRRGRVYVANAGPLDARVNRYRYAGPGSVSMVDERSGRVVGRVVVPASPVSLTLDPRAQRLFVGTASDGPYGTGAGRVCILDTTRLVPASPKASDVTPAFRSSRAMNLNLSWGIGFDAAMKRQCADAVLLDV